MDNKLILGYWQIRGLAQPIRFFLEYVGLAYEEKLYNDPQQWYGTDDVSFGHPFANLPYIKDGDKAVFESDALYYYIAHKANRSDLLGKDGWQQTQVATIRGVINDLKAAYLGYVYETKDAEGDKPKIIKTLGEFLNGFNFVLEKSTWLTGDSITYVDFLLWEYVDQFLVFAPELINTRPKLVEFHQRIAQLDQIKKYMENPNYIKRPFNSPNYAVFY